MDANGILNVTAKDKATNKEQKITIKGSTELTDEEVERMKKEAEAHAEEDKIKKERVEVRNQADNLIFTAEKTLKDAGDKINQDEKKKVEEIKEELKKAIEKDDFNKDDVEAKSKALSEALQKVGEAMYKEQSQNTDVKEETEDNTSEKKPDDKKDGPVEEGEVVNE